MQGLADIGTDCGELEGGRRRCLVLCLCLALTHAQMHGVTGT